MVRKTKNAKVRLRGCSRLRQETAPGPGPRQGLREYLERSVWPLIPPDRLGRVLTSEEEDSILGYGPEGY